MSKFWKRSIKPCFEMVTRAQVGNTKIVMEPLRKHLKLDNSLESAVCV